MCEELEQSSKTGNTRNLFQAVKKITNTFKPSLNIIKTKNGQLLTDKPAFATRWKEYCEELYNEDDPTTSTFTVIDKELPQLKVK